MWLFLLVFYWLWVWLAVLVARPRLVVYNISAEELRPVLAEAAREVDPQARWAGDSLVAAHAGRVAAHGVVRDHAARVAQVAAAASRTSPAGGSSRPSCATSWRTLRVGRNPRVARASRSRRSALIAVSIVHMLNDPQQVAQAVQEMLSF